MKLMLVIPAVYYSKLLAQCAVLWPEYRMLKNAILVHGERGDEIQLLCDPDRVQLILNLAHRVCAEAVPHIKQIADWLV